MKHTSGPWKVSTYNHIVTEGNEIIATAVSKKDMAIIAAAPEMYNLLYSLKELVSVANEEIIDEVLVKVEGRANSEE